MGYAGGEKENPRYYSLGDHTETVEVDFDPKKIGYEELLKTFWEGHDPAGRSWSRQYMSAVFYKNDDQRKTAEKSMAALAEKSGKTIRTKILPAGPFYRAEDYHQKYMLRQNAALIKEFARIYPIADDLTDSAAAARVNGFLGGFGTAKMLEKEIDDYGLTAEGRALVRRSVK